MTQSVNYVWRCRKCGAENPPRRHVCDACGYPAITVGSKTNDDSIARLAVPTAESVIARHAWAFFPEGLVALCIVVVAPAWSIGMMLDGRWGAGLVLLASTIGGAIVSWRGYRSNSAVVAWLGMIVVLGGAYGTRWL